MDIAHQQYVIHDCLQAKLKLWRQVCEQRYDENFKHYQEEKYITAGELMASYLALFKPPQHLPTLATAQTSRLNRAGLYFNISLTA